ncbi:hypothetical protein EG329_000222 [Mollisiaceae sp. DMI_Dod_QoI]|nr:hypothetical protein EG329_000222 [Helotiales sp. DMI_Dod_QoI]
MCVARIFAGIRVSMTRDTVAVVDRYVLLVKVVSVIVAAPTFVAITASMALAQPAVAAQCVPLPKAASTIVAAQTFAEIPVWTELGPAVAEAPCCSNVCGDTCLDGTGISCCGGSVCSSDQQCISNTCTSPDPPSSTPSSIPASPTPILHSSPSPSSSEPTSSTPLNPTSELLIDIPSSAQTDPAAACFLSTQYAPYYTTPTWYQSLDPAAQSLYSSSVAASATNSSAICTATGTINPADSHSGLSTGAKAGVAVGSIVGAAALAALGVFLYKAWRPAVGAGRRGGVPGVEAI